MDGDGLRRRAGFAGGGEWGGFGRGGGRLLADQIAADHDVVLNDRFAGEDDVLGRV